MNTRTLVTAAAVAAAGMIVAGSGPTALATPTVKTVSRTVACRRPAAPAAPTRFVWHPLHLMHGWKAFSAGVYGTPSYAVRDGVLYLRGILRAPRPIPGSPELVFARLPVGARPAHDVWTIYYNFGSGGSNLVSNMLIGHDGVMAAYANTGRIEHPSLQAI